MSLFAKFITAFGGAVVLLAIGSVPSVAADGADAKGGVVDAGSIATMQPITIAVSLPSEAHETARSWLFMIETLDGEAVEAISVETSAAVPASSAQTSPLPSGDYRVRIMFGNQIGTACGDGTFYQVILPATGENTITVDSSPALTLFTFARCTTSPTGLVVSVDEGAPDGGETPSAPLATFDDPLPPNTGSGMAAKAAGNKTSLVPIMVVLLAIALGAFAARPVVSPARS